MSLGAVSGMKENSLGTQMSEGDCVHMYMFLVNIFPFYGIEGLTPWQFSWNLHGTRDNLFVVRKLNTKLNERNRDKLVRKI